MLIRLNPLDPWEIKGKSVEDNAQHIIQQLKDLLEADKRLQSKLQQIINEHVADNPDTQTNPIRSLDDLYTWFNCFLTVMPWEGLTTGTKNKDLRQPTDERAKSKEQGAKTAGPKEPGLFRRIDRSIGYQYYIFGDLQYEPKIAEWLKRYNAAWAEHLNSSESWNNEYYELLRSDPLFELDIDKYESPDHWHCWNDFFSRRLNSSSQVPWVAEGQQHTWLPINADSKLEVPQAIKTTDIFDIKALLGNSRYNEAFANGSFTHITLDMYNYHHFHSPADGKIVDIQEIDGQLTSGGEIIWDTQQNRYRYRYDDNIGYQMIEKRVAIVIEQEAKSKEQRAKSKEQGAKSKEQRTRSKEQRTKNKEQGHLIAIIPIGVAQVGSVCIEKDIMVGAQVHQGQDLGHFLCGGSDVIILRSKDQRPTTND